MACRRTHLHTMSDLGLLPVSPATLPPAAIADLREALAHLRGGGGAVVRAAQALANLGAAPLLRRLGRSRGGAALEQIAREALERAFSVAVLGLPDTQMPDVPPARVNSATVAHVATAASGALSGAVGLAGAVPDAALTTLLIMRQIAQVALSQGEDLRQDEARRACLEVFALQAGEEGGYWSARLLLRGEPVAALVAQAARAWGMALSEKLAAQAAPVLGAAGGALVNTAFLAHYRTLARGHFAVRRLERRYGEAAVRAASAEIGAPAG
jgi:hypothetical protein